MAISALRPRSFIKRYLIGGIEKMVYKEKEAYLAFCLIAIGIEFLGKCLDEKEQDWNKPNKSKDHFELVFSTLISFRKYKPYYKKFKFHDSLRNGFSHSFVPKATIGLSSGDQSPNLYINPEKTAIALRCEDFFEDFRSACLEVCQKRFPKGDKMNKPLISVPSKY